MWPGRAALVAVAVLAVLPPTVEAATLKAKVASVSDGDSVKLKVGKRTRAFSLAGADAPEGAECFAAQAKAQLAKLLPRNARVRAATSGRSATITRGRTNVNKAMVRGGFARAAGSRFAADEAAAKAAGAGLWGACATTPGPSPGPSPSPSPTPQPPAPQPGDVTGQAAIDQMTRELQNGRWRSFTSSSQSSTEYIFNLCSDQSFLRTAQSNVGGVVFVAGQPWRVVEALIKGDGSYRGAYVEGTVTASDPPWSSATYGALLEVVVSGGSEQWYWDQDAAQYFPGAANCTG